MNRSILPLFAIFGALLLGLVLVVSAMTSGGNMVGQFAKYGLVACFFIGVLASRASLYLLILMTGYLDLLKRLMIFDGRVGILDLYYVLGMAPVLLAGITCGLLVKSAAPGKLHLMEWKLFLVSLVLFGLLAAGQMGTEISARTLGNVANSGAYAFLFFAIGSLVQSTQELRRLLLFAIAVFVPVALYTLWQSKVGLAQFEYDYLMSGLSIESRQLGERIFRPFSTMNAAANLSMMMGAMAVLALYTAFGFLGKLSLLHRVVLLSLVPLFCYAAYLTFSRGGWVCAAVALVAVFMFGSRFRTLLFYGVQLVLFGLVVGFAGTMVKEDTMATYTDEMLGSSISDEEYMVKKVVTFTDRLISIDLTLTEPKRWTPFGLTAAGVSKEQRTRSALERGDYFVHDGFSDLLLRFGYIPLTVMILVGVVVLVLGHRGILRLQGESRNMARLSAGMLVGLGVGFGANAAQLSTFPLNLYIYLFASGVIVLLRASARERVAVPSPSGRPAAAPGDSRSRGGTRLVPGH